MGKHSSREQESDETREEWGKKLTKVIRRLMKTDEARKREERRV